MRNRLHKIHLLKGMDGCSLRQAVRLRFVGPMSSVGYRGHDVTITRRTMKTSPAVHDTSKPTLTHADVHAL